MLSRPRVNCHARLPKGHETPQRELVDAIELELAAVWQTGGTGIPMPRCAHFNQLSAQRLVPNYACCV
jgi:hypothetical protein